MCIKFNEFENMVKPNISPTKSITKHAYAIPRQSPTVAAAAAFVFASAERPTARMIFSSCVKDAMMHAIKCVTVIMNRTGTSVP